MLNSWRVVLYRNHKRYIKDFKNVESPKPAVEFAKRAKAAGYSDVEIFSIRHSFPCPASKKKLGKAGELWCPRCLRWREFKPLVVRFPSIGLTEPDLRCPVCYITPRDYYVRMYNQGNPMLYREETVRLRVSRDSAASMNNIKRRRR